MGRFRSLILLTSLVFAPVAPALAAGFSTALVGSSQSGFGLYNPNSQHIVRNAKGTFLAYQLDANAAYNSNTERVVWFAGDPATTAPVTLYQGTSISEPPCLAVAWTGELFAVNVDWINNIISVWKWADVAASTAPQLFTFAGRPQRGNGKFTCAFDEQRRAVLFMGSGGEFVKIGENGGLLAAYPIFTAGTYPMMYPNLYVNRDGQLDMAWVTVDLSVPGQYRDIFYLGARTPVAWSMNGQAPWSWVTGSPPIPPDEGSATSWYVTYTNEMIADQNKLLISMISDEVGNVHFVYMAVAGSGERCFATANRCTLTYVRKNRFSQDGVPTAVERPLRAQTIFPHGAYGGVLAIRGQRLFFVTAYADRLVAIVSGDWGKSWQDFASLTIANAAGACVKDLNGDRGDANDPDIVGAFSIWHGGDCVAWANGSTAAGQTDVVFWRLGL